MKKAAYLLIFILFSSVFTCSCGAADTEIPTYDYFTIKATVLGEREFRATITESYAEFTGGNLTFPVRFEDGTVSCEGVTVDVKAKDDSLFRLSQIIAEALNGNGEIGKITQKKDRYEIEKTINGQQITVYIDKQTNNPTAFFTDKYTVEVTDFQDTTDESHTQNMGDG